MLHGLSLIVYQCQTNTDCGVRIFVLEFPVLAVFILTKLFRFEFVFHHVELLDMNLMFFFKSE